MRVQRYFFQIKKILIHLYKEKATATNKEILDALIAFAHFDTNPEILNKIRTDAGLVKRGVRYCFQVSPTNQIRRKSFALQKLTDGEQFLKHVWSDECVIQLEGNKATAYVMKKDKYGNIVQVPKYPRKILIWACISWFGAPLPIIFEEGTVDTDSYLLILERSLLPFLEVRNYSSIDHKEDNYERFSESYLHRRRFLVEMPSSCKTPPLHTLQVEHWNGWTIMESKWRIILPKAPTSIG